MAAPWQTVLERPAPQAARALLGWELWLGEVRARIVETEGYHTEADLACHASKGCTPRTETLYTGPGTLYVYLCYGMHWMLNLTCCEVGIPSAVLIRSIAVLEGDQVVRQRRGRSGPQATNGPGKVCAALGITGALNRQRLDAADCPLALLPPSRPVRRAQRGPRVGVAYAGSEWAGKPWRFWEPGWPVASPR